MASPRLVPSGWTPSAPPAMPWTPEHYSSVIILRVENEFRIIQRPPTYTDALNAAYTHFPCMKSHVALKLSTSFNNIWPEGGSGFCSVTSDTWGFIYPDMSVLFAEAEPEPRLHATRLNTQQIISAPGYTPVARAPRLFQLTINRLRLSTSFTLSVSPDTLVSQLYSLVASHESVAEDAVRLVFAGKQLDVGGGATLEDANIRNGGTVFFMTRLRGGKPVIYLFPPSPVRASVALSLSPSWGFDAIYPTTKIKDDLKVKGYPQTIQWEVDAQPSGDLVDRATDVQVSYLFWEALTNRSNIVQECPMTSFVPGLSTCTPSDSVVLEHADLLEYIDSALKVLGLHTKARTSFITYWLPAFQKHPFIALRFVPQSAYETAAPLTIEPKPDVVTRVFMLFKGLSSLRDREWFQAVERAEEDITRWKDIVGIEEDKQANRSLFRVLEWGGMEVYD